MLKGKNNPTVSVIIPTYNRAHLIGMAIESVLNQTYQDFEIIVVDDCSIDNTKDIVRSFQDDRIIYVRHDRNRGGSGTRNTGIKKSKGRLIAFLDDDNVWFNSKLKKQVEILESVSPDFGAIYCGAFLKKGDKETYFPPDEFRPVEGNIFSDLLERSCIDTSGMLIKREVFQVSGYFLEDLPRYQDWELCIRIAKHFKIKYLKEPLYYLSITDKSISTDIRAGITAYKKIYEKHQEDLKRFSQKHKFEYTIGQSECLSGDFSAGKIFLLKSIKTKVFQLRPYLALAISLLGKSIHNKFYNAVINIVAKPAPREK